MNKKIIFLIIIIVLGMSSYFYIKSRLNINIENNINNTNVIYNEKKYSNKIVEQKFYELESITEYYTIRSCLIKYFSCYYNLNNENNQVNKEGAENQLYSLLDKMYREEYGISLANIKNKFQNQFNEKELFIDKVFCQNDNNIKIYFVDGYIQDLVTNEFNKIKFIVRLDSANNTFSIVPEEYINDKNLNNIKEGDILDLKFDETILENKFNIYKSYTYSYDEYVKDMFYKIKNYMLYNPDAAFEILNKKESNLKNYSEFEKYVEENYKNIFVMTLDSYLYNPQNNYIKYECKDKYCNFEVLIYVKNSPCNINFTILKK